MPDRLSEKVSLGVVYGTLEPDFVWSLVRLLAWDGEYAHRLSHRTFILPCQTTNIAAGRNTIVRAFLEEGDADWLLFVDTDQTFDADLIERMVLSADPVERPVVSALIMAERPSKRIPIAPACTVWNDEVQDFVIPHMIPADRHWQVATVGTGCLLVHRSVLERMGAEWADDAFPWFKYAQHNRKGVPDVMGEDYTFSLRATKLEVPLVVDTTIQVGHVKKRTLTAADFWAQVPDADRPRRCYAVIPTKGRLDLVSQVVADLRRDGGYDGIVVCDNGSPRKLVNWCESQDDVTRLDCADMGIHEMWNAAVDATAGWPHTDYAFLNNDLRLGVGMLPVLRRTLVEHPELLVVCPNYDGRDMLADVEQRSDICADRYDGTGGIAGFAFVVRGEVFAQGYRFPAECKWWYGDNDLLLAVGGRAAIVRDATVEHLDGGSQTGRWDDPEMAAQLEADREAWFDRLRSLGLDPKVAADA